MSRVVIYDAALNRLLKSSTGPVARIIDGKAERIFQGARAQISQKYDSRTGDLEAGLRKIPRDTDQGYSVAVGSDATHRGFPYARALETGINPWTGEPMNIDSSKIGFMVPAVRAAGFRQRGA